MGVNPRGKTDPEHYESRRDTRELCHYSDHCINSTLSLSQTLMDQRRYDQNDRMAVAPRPPRPLFSITCCPFLSPSVPSLLLSLFPSLPSLPRLGVLTTVSQLLACW